MMTDKKYLAEQISMTSGVDVHKCMMGGKCSASCPSYDEMEYHPHQFVKMVESGDIEPLLESESLYHCLTCFACVDRCPRGVKPANVVEAVRLAAVRRKGGNHLPPDRLPELLDEDIPGQALVSAMRKYVK